MKPDVEIPEEQRQILEQFTRRRRTPQWLAIRAQIILALTRGGSIRGVARQLEIARNTVVKWLRRWQEQSPKLSLHSTELTKQTALELKIREALTDRPRRGRPATFSAEQIVAIVAVSLQSPAKFDRPVSHWTPTELALEVIKQGVVETISPRSVGRFLKSGRLETPSLSVLAQS